jgi:adenylate cyclase
VSDDRLVPPHAADVTGELPQVVVDAITRRPRAALSESDEDVVAALVELGVDRDEARQAVLDDRVPLLLTSQVLGEHPRHSLEDLARASGLAPEALLEIRAATGIPPAGRYSDADLEWARRLAPILGTLPLDAVIRSARARGLAMSAVARADLSMVRDQVVLPMRREGADDLEVSVAFAETVRSLQDAGKALLLRQYELQLQHEIASELSALAARTHAPEIDVAIAFVDVVGYTALTSRIDPSGLEGLLDTFEARVVDVLSTAREVAAVKLLGDAVMLVAGDVAELTDVLLELTTEVDTLVDFPLRAGMSAGPTLIREGDYFGPAVNMAARLTDLARPWTVLADDELADRLEGFETRRLRPTRVRGVGVRRPLSVRGH